MLNIKKIVSKIRTFPIFVQLFYLFFLITTCLSAYIFMQTIIFNNDAYANLFSTWQFPMLSAILLDTLYLNKQWI